MFINYSVIKFVFVYSNSTSVVYLLSPIKLKQTIQNTLFKFYETPKHLNRGLLIILLI
jgi:hypothetical protein